MNTTDRALVNELVDRWLESSALADELRERVADLASHLFPRHRDQADRIARGAVEVVERAVERHRGLGPKRVAQRVRGALLRYLLEAGIELALQRS